MTARLPTPGSDSGAWGDLLNTWLQVGHDAAGNNLNKLYGSTVTLSAQAYTTVSGDLGKILLVASGVSNATITLLSAATAAEGSLHIVTKSDSAAGRVVVSDGANDLAWLSAQNDVVVLRSNGTSWVAVGWNIKPIKDVFTSIGANTWTKAPLASWVRVLAIGAGGGGGSGRRGATSSIRGGGGPGVGGAIVQLTFQASVLGATETVTIVDGTVGGSAQTVDSTNGNPSTQPASTTFGAWVSAAGGGSATGGTNASGGGFGNFFNSDSNYGLPGSGNSGITTANLAQSHGGNVGTGSAGGGADASNNARTPAAGTIGSMLCGTTTAAGAAGTSGNDGGKGADVTDTNQQIGGGGGGGGFYATGAAGTNGGAGGLPGAGGGGGAASDNGNNSGAGGKGGRGEVRVWQYFG